MGFFLFSLPGVFYSGSAGSVVIPWCDRWWDVVWDRAETNDDLSPQQPTNNGDWKEKKQLNNNYIQHVIISDNRTTGDSIPLSLPNPF